MPKSFQWITLLLIESIYFVGIKVKGPHTLVWIIPSKSTGTLRCTSKLQTIEPLGSTSKFQIHWTSEKHVQTSNHRTSGKHVQNSISMDLWEARPNSNPSDLYEARPKFNFNGPLGSTSKFQSIGPLGSTSKFQIHRTSRKHVQISNPSDLWEARPC